MSLTSKTVEVVDREAFRFDEESVVYANHVQGTWRNLAPSEQALFDDFGDFWTCMIARILGPEALGL